MHSQGTVGRDFLLAGISSLATLMANSIAHLFTPNIIPGPLTDPTTLTAPTFHGYAPITVTSWDTRGVDVDGVPYVTSEILHWEAVDGAIPQAVQGIWVGLALGSGAVTNATNASPIVVTSAAHGLANGDKVLIAGVTGNTAANGTWLIDNVTANTFELLASAGNGAFVAGGTWSQQDVTPAVAAKFAAPVSLNLAGDACNVVLKLRADGQVLALLGSDI